MNTLEERREIAQVSFIQSLLNGAISAPQLLCRINWNIPQTRNFRVFNTTFFADPINVMIKKYNIHAVKFDFNQKTDSIRENLKNYYIQFI